MDLTQEYQNQDYLFQWVYSQIQYHSDRNQSNRQRVSGNQKYRWTQLIDIGFVDKLFIDIDGDYFSRRDLVPEDMKLQSHKKLNQYWQILDEYLGKSQNKRVDPNQLQKYLNPNANNPIKAGRSNKNMVSLQSSLQQLIKLQFYLLVQKHNMTNQLLTQQWPSEKQMRQLDQTRQSSLLQNEYDNGLYSESEGQSHLKHQNAQFLSRICQLPQEVQQYLVSVVEQVQKNQLLVMSDQMNSPHNHLSNTKKQSSISANPSYNKKIVYRQLQFLNQENEQLKEKIQLIVQQNLKLQKQLEENINEQATLIKSINQYNEEKQELFNFIKQQNDFQINSLQEFVDVIKHIEQENELLENTIAEIEQQNYELQTTNAQKVHAINKSALQISKINDQITIYKSKIKQVKQDINFLDQIVNNNSYHNDQFNVQLVTSIDIDDQNQMIFNKSIENTQRRSFGNVLRENKDIYNQKITDSNNRRSYVRNNNRILTESLSGFNSTNTQKSFNQQKSIKLKRYMHTSTYQNDQQNVEPFHDKDLQVCISYASKSSCSVFYAEDNEQERLMKQQQQKYRLSLVRNLEELYKEISDLTNQVTSIKEDNKCYEKKNKVNQKKLNDLKQIHQAFLREAFQM